MIYINPVAYAILWSATMGGDGKERFLDVTDKHILAVSCRSVSLTIRVATRVHCVNRSIVWCFAFQTYTNSADWRGPVSKFGQFYACLTKNQIERTTRRPSWSDFWATVCKTVRPMLSDRCPGCLSVLSCLWRWCTVAKRLDGSRWNLACR